VNDVCVDEQLYAELLIMCTCVIMCGGYAQMNNYVCS